jgi:hypothetical protein
MKRIFALGIVLVLVIVVVPSFAAGKLVSSQENLYVVPYFDTSVYSNFYAELTNEGDKPVEFSNGLLELYDADGNSIVSSEIYYCYPMVLEPGENAYLLSNEYPDLAGKTIEDHMLSVMGQGKVTQKITRLLATAITEAKSDGYYTYNYLTATITNNTEEVLYGFEAVFALKDAEGNLLYVVNNSWYGYNVGIMPGSSVQLQLTMDSTVSDYLTTNNLVPATTECIAYSTTSI